MSSTPAKVHCTASKVLNPNMGCVIRFTTLCSYSTILFKYFTCWMTRVVPWSNRYSINSCSSWPRVERLNLSLRQRVAAIGRRSATPCMSKDGLCQHLQWQGVLPSQRHDCSPCVRCLLFCLACRGICWRVRLGDRLARPAPLPPGMLCATSSDGADM